MKNLSKIKIIVILTATCLLLGLFFFSSWFPEKKTSTEEKLTNLLSGFRPANVATSKGQTPTPTPTFTPAPRPRSIPTPTPNPDDSRPWGVAWQIDQYTWRMKVQNDDRIATAQELFEALNEYRRVHGVGSLSWDDKLNQYAKERAHFIAQNGKTDEHRGFLDFIYNQDGFNKLGFNYLLENNAYGYQLYGVHLIEWIFAGDEDHNRNQLDANVSHIGIAIEGLAVELIFGGRKY